MKIVFACENAKKKNKKKTENIAFLIFILRMQMIILQCHQLQNNKSMMRGFYTYLTTGFFYMMTINEDTCLISRPTVWLDTVL